MEDEIRFLLDNFYEKILADSKNYENIREAYIQMFVKIIEENSDYSQFTEKNLSIMADELTKGLFKGD